MTITAARELQVHLDILEIGSALGSDGVLSIVEPAKLLAHLTDEVFIARNNPPSATGDSIPVPTHRTDNPVGALQEWSTKRKVICSFTQSENIGTVHAPRFACEVSCDGETLMIEAASKAVAKREAALATLYRLAQRHGRERL